jgi:rhodanese-related sulfurtransferase
MGIIVTNIWLRAFRKQQTYRIKINAAPVIVFCRSGRRAGKAKEMLELKGYTNVLNAGALTDLVNALGSD